MPRPDRKPERRIELAPVLALAFVELGYRRATTAELAARCGVQENILYRLWPDKQEMFIAALDHVWEVSKATWTELLAKATDDVSPAEVVLEHEAGRHGEFGLYRIVFAGLSETDDPRIAAALRKLYGRFQRFTRRQVEAHRGGSAGAGPSDAALAAWALVGLGTIASIGRELGLLSPRARSRLFAEVGRALLGERG